MKNFEEITRPLSDVERRAVPIIVERFRKRPGKTNVVTSKTMIDGLKEHFGIELNDSRIRKIIQYIRLNGLLIGLVATSSGYFLTQNPKDLEEWIESLKQREEAIRAIRLTAEKDLQKINDGMKTGKLF